MPTDSNACLPDPMSKLPPAPPRYSMCFENGVWRVEEDESGRWLDRIHYDALRAVALELERDALRYRWLRVTSASNVNITREDGSTLCNLFKQRLDAAIDEAMAQPPKEAK